jgi:ATP-dependent Clp protease protease subunit
MKKEKERDNPKEKPIREFDNPIKYSDEYYYTLVNKERRILLYDEINDSSSYVINFKMRGMSAIDKKSPILLEINSGGGDVHSGLSIIDTIENIEAPVITIANGMVASMAFLISICGDKRWATKNSWFMQHPVSTMVQDYAQFVKDQVEFLVRLEKQSEAIMRKHTHFKAMDYRKLRNGEIWLSSKEALEKGVIDKII